MIDLPALSGGVQTPGPIRTVHNALSTSAITEPPSLIDIERDGVVREPIAEAGSPAPEIVQEAAPVTPSAPPVATAPDAAETTGQALLRDSSQTAILVGEDPIQEAQPGRTAYDITVARGARLSWLSAPNHRTDVVQPAQSVSASPQPSTTEENPERESSPAASSNEDAAAASAEVRNVKEQTLAASAQKPILAYGPPSQQVAETFAGNWRGSQGPGEDHPSLVPSNNDAQAPEQHAKEDVPSIPGLTSIEPEESSIHNIRQPAKSASIFEKKTFDFEGFDWSNRAVDQPVHVSEQSPMRQSTTQHGSTIIDPTALQQLHAKIVPPKDVAAQEDLDTSMTDDAESPLTPHTSAEPPPPPPSSTTFAQGAANEYVSPQVIVSKSVSILAGLPQGSDQSQKAVTEDAPVSHFVQPTALANEPQQSTVEESDFMDTTDSEVHNDPSANPTAPFAGPSYQPLNQSASNQAWHFTQPDSTPAFEDSVLQNSSPSTQNVLTSTTGSATFHQEDPYDAQGEPLTGFEEEILGEEGVYTHDDDDNVESKNVIHQQQTTDIDDEINRDRANGVTAYSTIDNVSESSELSEDEDDVTSENAIAEDEWEKANDRAWHAANLRAEITAYEGVKAERAAVQSKTTTGDMQVYIAAADIEISRLNRELSHLILQQNLNGDDRHTDLENPPAFDKEFKLATARKALAASVVDLSRNRTADKLIGISNEQYQVDGSAFASGRRSRTKWDVQQQTSGPASENSAADTDADMGVDVDATVSSAAEDKSIETQDQDTSSDEEVDEAEEESNIPLIEQAEARKAVSGHIDVYVRCAKLPLLIEACKERIESTEEDDFTIGIIHRAKRIMNFADTEYGNACLEWGRTNDVLINRGWAILKEERALKKQTKAANDLSIAADDDLLKVAASILRGKEAEAWLKDLPEEGEMTTAKETQIEALLKRLRFFREDANLDENDRPRPDPGAMTTDEDAKQDLARRYVRKQKKALRRVLPTTPEVVEKLRKALGDVQASEEEANELETELEEEAERHNERSVNADTESSDSAIDSEEDEEDDCEAESEEENEDESDDEVVSDDDDANSDEEEEGDTDDESEEE